MILSRDPLLRFLDRQPMGKWAIQALEAGQGTIECLL
jgi:hypothetical protein